MKRNLQLFAAWIAIIAVFAFTGCGLSEFSVNMKGGNTITITARNASKNSVGSTGGLYVGKNEKVVIEPALEGDGRIQVRLAVGLPGADVEEEEPVFLETVSGTKKVEIKVPLGEYSFEAKALNRTNGTVSVKVEHR